MSKKTRARGREGERERERKEANKRGSYRERKIKRGREKKKVKENGRGQERERYRKNGEKGKLQLLNDHPVHSYLSWIGFPFSPSFAVPLYSLFPPQVLRAVPALGAAGTIICNCFP